MINITSYLVKKLRLRTGIGIMDCKQALINSKGDFEQAIIYLRKHGKITALKKNANIAARGVVSTYLKDNFGYMIELNCETDFVSRHIEFINFAKNILIQSHLQQLKDLEWLRTVFEEDRISLISKFNENIIIRRFCFLEGNTILSYDHIGRVGVLLNAQSCDKEVLKYIAMHIAASRPEYIDVSDIPKEIVHQEREIQLEIALKTGKNKEIAQKIVHGRINKFINRISLLEQDFIIDPTKKVKTVLNENNIKILKFFRFEVGENI
ncbi:translation elongation factor Ts [Buchnera aphidicola]|uniref:translation elongation factor Ts n=1 Tax=Buchnera aphidicola TaxID=9 RepID=UPI0034641CC7